MGEEKNSQCANGLNTNLDNEWQEYHEKLLRITKKEVKQIMEEAVTRKYVHEDSGSITSLCAAVDACLSHGLKRRALGLFKTNSTTALLQKVAKNCECAAKIYRMVIELEKSVPQRGSSSDSQPFRTRAGSMKQANGTVAPPKLARYLWIRVALFEKQLYYIIEHLVQNATMYYEKEALVADKVCGQVFASLLVGPCALDYSRMKSQDQFWNDLPADELVQRHYLVNGPPVTMSSSPNSRKAPLHLSYSKSHVSWLSNSEPSICTNGSEKMPGEEVNNSIISCGSPALSTKSAPFSPKEYVESLHQNCKSTLLYGKNNVWVQPKEDMDPLPGYLSLHQTQSDLEVRWTPNQLMNNSSDENNDKSVYWNYALNVNVVDIVYLHCHQEDNGGVIVFVGQDGVQKSPIRFPKGSHLLAFLSCLENGLQPTGQLDPPLWTQKGKGKVFPRLKKRSRTPIKQKDEETIECKDEIDEENEECSRMDYVFRIVTSFDKPDIISEEMFNPKAANPTSGPPITRRAQLLRCKLIATSSSSSSSSSSSRSEDSQDRLRRSVKNSQSDSMTDGCISPYLSNNSCTSQPIASVCESMKRQIIARAFHGWLAHCRHLRTVRTHLAGLVNSINIVEQKEQQQALTSPPGLLDEHSLMDMMDNEGRIIKSEALLKSVYFAGCDPSLRPRIWPFLLGYYSFSSTADERKTQDCLNVEQYELFMSEWLAVEAIVKQRDKECLAANLAKLSSGSSDEKDLQLSNDVFTDSDTEQMNTNNASSSQERRLTRKRKVRSSDFSINSNSQILITNPSVDCSLVRQITEHVDVNHLTGIEEKDCQLSAPNSTCVSPASSNGGCYSNELLDLFSLNLHRIEKDVQRCDRNYPYFMKQANLEKLRNVICTYVWQNLQQGYVQGMCDLVAPFLVIFNDETMSYFCFCELMKRMSANFPHGGAMDTHFASMRSLIQILDPDLFKLMHSNGDYTHFYFCYRWFLLDFKREFCYEDVFKVWEMIWAGRTIASSNLVLFIALALVHHYRDIILENNMDFTDVIKFFNEMAERHDANSILKSTRELVLRIQQLIC